MNAINKYEKKMLISILMPCYNEEGFISDAIESLVDDYVKINAEILVLDGISTDYTREKINVLQKKGYPIRIIDNKKRLQNYGLNIGIKEAKGDIIIRADAHCLYPKDYVKMLVELLETKDAANVGGVMFPMGNNMVQKAIALAMRHPIGVGNASFHLGNFSGYVDTVFLGAFKKSLFDEIGVYDIKNDTNEDAELNLRILKVGKKIYLDSSIRVKYYPRSTFTALIKQYYSYGVGRAYTVSKHRQFTSYRQILPVLLVILFFLSLIAIPLSSLAIIFPLSYLLSLIIASFFCFKNEKPGLWLRLNMALAFGIMHLSWGAGFLRKVVFKSKVMNRN